MGTNSGIAFGYFESKFSGSEKKRRILDIGANSNPWALDWLTHVIDDTISPESQKKFNANGIEVFNFDIEDCVYWDAVLNDVEKNGKFDFIICSHTLEDISNPKSVCRIINEIGKAGFISTPSKYAELTLWQRKYHLPYKGYHHHRWIYQIKNNVLIGYPKMNFHDYVDFSFDQGKARHSEIAFLWEDKFEYEFIRPANMMDNKQGPNKLGDLFEDDDLIL
jgi:hypothetical protein